jgi:hypothetical protein
VNDKVVGDWRGTAADSEARPRVLREYAEYVFDSAEQASRWLNRSNRAIARLDTPLEAARTIEGFFEAMAELARLDQFEQRETMKRAQLSDWPSRTSKYDRAA